MSEQDFDWMTPRVFFNKLTGYSKQREIDYKNGWEQVRWIVWQMVSVSGKSLQGKVQLTDIIKFDWEKVIRVKADEKRDKKRFEELVEKFGSKY